MQNNTITLRSGRHGKIRPGHPWIHKRQFLKQLSPPNPGDIVSVKTADGKFVGVGYYNPRSEISVRMLSFSQGEIDADFFKRRIEEALAKREKLAAKTNAYRAVFSEADGLPGLITDIYSDTVVFQILTLGMERFKGLITDCLKTVLSPKFLYEKSDGPFRKQEGLKTLKGWHGPEGKSIVEIFEDKASFLVDIENGHKTGFYLDQRNSRMALRNTAKGKKVLDLFCYTGAFSVHAALAGAKSITAVDIKENWLALGRKNAALNDVRERIEFARADSFAFLKNVCNSKETFDIIIVDPPSFVKSRRSLVSASKGYNELNLMAMKSLTEGGILATFSCSHNMPNEAFSSLLKEAAAEAGKKFTILKRCHQAEDHPIVKNIPETEYLKGYFLRLESTS